MCCKRLNQRCVRLGGEWPVKHELLRTIPTRERTQDVLARGDLLRRVLARPRAPTRPPVQVVASRWAQIRLSRHPKQRATKFSSLPALDPLGTAARTSTVPVPAPREGPFPFRSTSPIRFATPSISSPMLLTQSSTATS